MFERLLREKEQSPKLRALNDRSDRVGTALAEANALLLVAQPSQSSVTQHPFTMGFSASLS